LRYGSGTGGDLAAALTDWEQHGIGAVAQIRLADELGQTQVRTMRLAVPGRHMALNALGAVLAALEAGASLDSVLDGLAGFEGVRRRFELVGSAAGVRVFDDYAHHPTEVRAALTALRAIAQQDPTGHPAVTGARSIVVFQPHLYSRTKTFAREFAEALEAADEVFVLDVYAAREQPLAGVSGATIAGHVGVPVHYVPDFSAVAGQVAAVTRPGDVVVTMGAGDVTLLGPEIITALRAGPGRGGSHD
jgi:UDP-N-acetylmuramate--alanine ligase